MEPGPSKEINSPRKKRQKVTSFTSNEKNMVINVYKYVKQNWPSDQYPYKTEINKKTADILGIGIASVELEYNILKQYKSDEGITSPVKTKERPKIHQKVDDFDKSAIRKKIHSFFLKCELPTIKKVLQAVNDDDELPNFSESTLRRLIKHLHFKYIKRQRNNALIDRDDIVIWRRTYLKKIKEYRRQNRQIFYMDETWVNAGHTVSKTWVDKEVKSKKQAFLEGLSTGASNPTSKGRRLIITHIGNENGFVEGGESIFECKKTGDYHESMDATHFEQWFENVLPKLGENAVVVMDNAPYHSRRLEKTPINAWRKAEIQNWLQSKNISFDEKDIKTELLQKVKNIKDNFKKYAVDELAKKYKVEVLRLPPYHCELNPIELVWADVKGYVARKNTNFKFQEVKSLLQQGLQQITVDKWKHCVEHVIKEEDNFYGNIDEMIDSTVDSFVIHVSDSETEYSESSEDDE